MLQNEETGLQRGISIRCVRTSGSTYATSTKSTDADPGGSTSQKEDNTQLLCVRHSLQKSVTIL